MGKRKRKLSGAEKAARKKRRQEYGTRFIRGKRKHVRRPPTIEGKGVDDFLRENADPIFLHQEELWEYLEPGDAMDSRKQHTPAATPKGREPVSFITIEDGEDLIVAYAIALDEPGEVATVMLHRTKYEELLPPEEQGVVVSHKLFPEEAWELARRIVVEDTYVDIDSTVRTYRLDLSAVDPAERAEARKALERMHQRGGFELVLRQSPAP